MKGFFKMILRSAFTLSMLLILTTALSVAQDPPVVIWTSSPVQPGETVLIHGGNFGENPVVELTEKKKKVAISPLSVSESSIMFTLPETWTPGLVNGVVRSGELVSKVFQLNAPDIWWIHGDRGREASTKQGHLKLIGNCLLDPKKPAPEVFLHKITDGKKVKPVSLSVVKYNRYFVQTDSWEELPEGTYEIKMIQPGNNNPLTAGEIRISEKINIFPEEVFNVVDFGAIPNDGIDDTYFILQALEQLKKNGGGILFFPVGRFQMNQTIELPPYSVLKGLGADFSQIYWPDTYEPLPALIRGTHSFEVSNIFLTCGNHRDGIVGSGPEVHGIAHQDDYKEGNITVMNVTLRMLHTQYLNHDMDEMKRRLPPIHMARALRLGGENLNVTGNNVYCAAGGVFEFRGYWSNISDNIFSRGNVIGWSGFRGQQLIFMNNHMGGASCISYYALPEGSENIYWGNNFIENTFDGNNRESITGDLRIIAYHNTIKNITPTSFTTITGESKSWVIPSIFNTTGEIASPTGKIEYWKNGAVQIAAGKGVGQIKRIKAVNGTKIELESPWDITPDETSIINITSYRRRFIYTENKTYDSSIALQFYGSMIEAIVANNITSRTGGFTGDTNRDMPNWFNQFYENTIISGNAYRGPRNQVPATDAHLGLLGHGSDYPVIRSCVIRNNELKSNAKLDVTGNIADCLFEKNNISYANIGATIDPRARNIVLSKNTFNKVLKPYQYDPRSVVIRPIEELWSAMDGVSALMGWESREDMPAGWPEIYANKELVNTTQDQLIPLWEKAVIAFAKQYSDKSVSDKLAEVLLGLQIQEPNWQAMYSNTRDGRAGNSPLLIRVTDSRVKAHMKLSLRSEDFPLDGWIFKIPESDLEPGKSTEFNSTITKPEGKASMLKIPLNGEITGDGWKLQFTKTIVDSYDKISLEKFKFSRPMDNLVSNQLTNNMDNPGQIPQIRLGYIKYEDIIKPDINQLIDASVTSGGFNFEPLYSGTGNEGKLIYGITTLKAKSPVTAKFEFSRNCLLFVNGKIVGTNLGRGQWGFIRLEEGDNKVEMIILPIKNNNWHFGFPVITWIEKNDLVSY